MVNLLLSAVAGFLLSAAFEPVALWWLAPIAITFHIFILSRTKNALASTFVFAFTFNAFLLHWTSTYVGSMPWVVLSLGLTLLYLPLALVKKWGIASYPLLFVVLEELRNRVPFGGFGWARLAYSQPDAPYSDLARLGGATALSSVVVVLGLFIYWAINRSFQPLLLLPFLLLLIPYNIVESGQTRTLLIQGNVPTLGLDFNKRATQVFNNHNAESQKALKAFPNIDFMLWPENAVDVDPFTNQKIKDTLNSYTVPLIVGAIVKDKNGLLNTSILWTDEAPNVYTKQALTPFGEYIPLRNITSRISPLVNQVYDFTAGNSGKIFEIKNAKIAPIICFELIQDEIVQVAARNSNILAVQTNSATFGTSPESAQQLSITRIRAIEHSRNIVSVSTTGYSAVIDYSGSILQKSQMGTAEHLYASVGLIDQQSPSNQLGDWALVIQGAFLLIVARRRLN